MTLIKSFIKDAFGGSLKDLEKGDFTILGIPFDDKSSYQKGSSGGPDSIREVSTEKSIGSYTEKGVDLKQDTSIIDLGNIDCDVEYDDLLLSIENHIKEIVMNNSIPVVLGGDHSNTYPVVKGVKNVYKDLDTSTLAARTRLVVQSAFGGKRLVICSGGDIQTTEDLFEEVQQLKDGGASGSIVGRNSFQRPENEAIALLNKIQDIYAS